MSHDEIELSHTNDCDRPPLAERIAAVYERVTAWQCKTFPAQTIEGVVAHMRDELREIEAAPNDVSERADMAILAMALVRLKRGRTRSGDADAYRFGDHSPKEAIYRMHEWLDKEPPDIQLVRWLAIASFGTGLSGSQFIDAIEEKHAENLTRKWPRPEDQDPTKPIEHVREVDGIPVLPTTFFDEPVCEVVCATCNDSHRMTIGGHEREVPCTRCPRPCENCRVGGYCRTAKCNCECHAIKTNVREEPWPARIERVATESLSVEGQIAHLRAEVDGLRLEMERVRVALHAKKDETTAAAAARVWSELLAAEGRGRDVLSALGRPIIEDPVKAAQRVVVERDALKAEQVEWLANNEALRLERDDVRKVLDAQPHETVAMAAQRVAETCGTLKEERGRLRADRDQVISLQNQIRAALGTGEGWTAAALIERAGQLHDDSVAYRSLRGRMVEMLGCSGDFTERDILDLIADRINGPITESEEDLEDRVRQLEGDVGALKAALHVATRGQS